MKIHEYQAKAILADHGVPVPAGEVVFNADEAEKAAKAIIGMRLVTYQTGPNGQVVQRVLVEQGLKIKRELYLGLVLDRSAEKPVLMVSPDGGVEIEKVAEKTPEKIFK